MVLPQCEIPENFTLPKAEWRGVRRGGVSPTNKNSNHFVSDGITAELFRVWFRMLSAIWHELATKFVLCAMFLEENGITIIKFPVSKYVMPTGVFLGTPGGEGLANWLEKGGGWKENGGWAPRGVKEGSSRLAAGPG